MISSFKMDSPAAIEKYQKLAQKLEIVLFTYNRAKDLDNTLHQLRGCPFSYCKIIILDNCSPDNTYEVVQSHIPFFPNMVYEKNKINIGGNANILRAAEKSNGLYTWLICDDDFFDFSDCEDVIDIILEEKVNLIHVGGHDVKSWQPAGLIATPQELMNQGYNYFNNASFVPCSIFKTEIFYQSLDAAYQNIRNWYPHLIYTQGFFNRDEPIYISKRRFVTASVVDTGLNYTMWLDRWINTSSLLKTSKEKRDHFFDVYFGENRALSLAKLTYHALDRQASFSNLFRIFLLYKLLGLIMSLVFILGIGVAYPVIKLRKCIKK